MIKRSDAAEGLAFRREVVAFVARATTALEGVEVLAKSGFAPDATSVMRTVCELDIDLAYICREDTETRMSLFFGYAAVRDLMTAQPINNLHRSADETALAELTRRRNAVEHDYPDKYSRNGKDKGHESVGKRAKATGRELQYDLLYAEACAAVHSGPQTIRHTIHHETRQLCIGPQRPPSRPIELAISCYLRLLDTVITFWNLDLSPRLGTLWDELTTAPPGGVARESQEEEPA